MYLVRSHKGSLVGPKTVNFSQRGECLKGTAATNQLTFGGFGVSYHNPWVFSGAEHWGRGGGAGSRVGPKICMTIVRRYMRDFLCWMFLSGTCHRLRQEVRTHPDAATGDPAWWQQIFQLILEQWSSFKSTFKGIFWKKNLRIWDKDFSDSPSRIWKNQDLAVLSFLVVHLHSNEWVLDASEAQRLYVPLRLEGYGSGRGPVWELTKADESTTFQISSL